MSSMGDIVLTEPVVAAIRRARPEARIGFALKERYRELVCPNPAVDAVHTARDSSPGETARLACEIRAERYTAVIDLHSNLRTKLLAARSGARARTAYVKRERFDSLRVRFLGRTFRARKKLVERYLDALEPLGIPHPYERPRFHLDRRAHERARGLLDASGLGRGPMVAVAPGSIWETKRWPADRYSEAVRRLVAELGVEVVVLGSSDERALCEQVAEAEGALSLAGSLSPGEMAAVIAQASVYVGNDSGPTHVAMALDVPSVAIFGPTDPDQFDFRGHALLYVGVDCSACSFYGGRRCRRGHWECMLRVGVDDVVDAAGGLLEKRRGAPRPGRRD